ncbi:MAG: hypothetical protein ACLT5C_13285 [Blautia hansenii]
MEAGDHQQQPHLVRFQSQNLNQIYSQMSMTSSWQKRHDAPGRRKGSEA